jgi:hypothetical protein
MTLPIASLTSPGAATTLPALNVHSHGHGHKKGLDSLTDPSSSTAAQPAGSTQDLFGSLLSSLEQVIGMQPANGSSQTAANHAASTGQTNTQVVPAASALGEAAKSVLGTVGSALKLFA